MNAKRLTDGCVALICTAMIGWSAISLAAGRDRNLGDLRGAAGCDNCACKDTSISFTECLHTSMDPSVPCNGTSCIEDIVYLAECPAKEGGKNCPLAGINNEIFAIQIVRDAGVGCPGNPAQVPVHPGNACSGLPTGTARCLSTSCGGNIISTSSRTSAKSVCK